MTSLFQEYEAKRLTIINSNQLIGRKFYWSIDVFTGEPLPRRICNEFEIVKIITESNYYEASVQSPCCEYQYLHYGCTTGIRPLKEILENSTEILD